MTGWRVLAAVAPLATLVLAACDNLPFRHKVEQLLPCWPQCEDVAACLTDGDCDDADDCTQDACHSGVCTHAPVDGDGDGHGAFLCGGDDCDDAADTVHPGASEGTAGSAACTDGIDNDCDGAIDLVEQGCLSGVCNEHGWCWVAPRPSGTWLTGVWQASADELWAVGSTGTILRTDGVHFEQTPTGSVVNLRAIWGANATAIWAVGEDGLILHWDGSAWAPQDSGAAVSLHGVHGTSSTDVWAVGEQGTVRHWDGAAWSSVPSGTTETLWSAWAATPADAWFAGDNDTPLHWDGATAQRFTCGTSTSFMSVHGLAADHVWAVGPGANSVFCLWDGQAWSPRGPSLGARAVHAITASEAWAFGLDGRMVRWDGNAWSYYFESPVPTLEHLFAAASVAANDLWAAGSNGELIHWEGASWARVRPEFAESLSFADVWGCAPDDVWLSGGETHHHDGGSVQPRGPALSALHGFACDDLFGIDHEGLAWHWDGTSWQSEATGTVPATGASAGKLGGTGDDDLWLLGRDGEIWHRDATTWSLAHTAPALLRGVFALAPDDVWVVGENGFTAHFDGLGWIEIAGPTAPELDAVWASGPNDVWATGQAATWRWDGTQWSVVPGLPLDWAVAGVGARSLDGRSADDVWLLNVESRVAHWDGSTWTELPTPVSVSVLSIFAAPWGEVWVVGGGSTVLRRSP